VIGNFFWRILKWISIYFQKFKGEVASNFHWSFKYARRIHKDLKWGVNTVGYLKFIYNPLKMLKRQVSASIRIYEMQPWEGIMEICSRWGLIFLSFDQRFKWPPLLQEIRFLIECKGNCKPIFKWGVSKRGILRSLIFHVLNSKSWNQLILWHSNCM